MTTAKPLAHYSAIEGALASGFATAELHHLWGRDRDQYLFIEASLPKPGSPLGLSRPGRIDTLVRRFDQTYRDKVALVARLPITLSGVRDQRVSLSSTSFPRARGHKQGRFAPGTGTPVVGRESQRGRPFGRSS
ncbi:MAG: hypothetical protein EOS04_03020 [Mesorhizobium sp.]|nr:MAG: hypothetical protein EOR98_16350 [Mesorhizobium sp.]RWN79413.1 MAG: hypothetical protein EOS02_07700 [Mesorhizobium sp.]RWN84971.1 MAG: hypothetical protein EOS01_03030 [Mesorhizobium sp.]RWN93089.1 MAG: hypothetical protein EOS04_03020 [Mesorhizobium sp.]RWO17106.1 MAG: hypothetical protein EOS15_00670 [Mesorhizobium sp.]